MSRHYRSKLDRLDIALSEAQNELGRALLVHGMSAKAPEAYDKANRIYDEIEDLRHMLRKSPRRGKAFSIAAWDEVLGG